MFPPVISAVEFDIIYDFHNLQDSLECYFLSDDHNQTRKEKLAGKPKLHIPFWSDIINYNIKTAAERYNEGIKRGIIKDRELIIPEDFM
jgi:hypothetical protein